MTRDTLTDTLRWGTIPGGWIISILPAEDLFIAPENKAVVTGIPGPSVQCGVRGISPVDTRSVETFIIFQY